MPRTAAARSVEPPPAAAVHSPFVSKKLAHLQRTGLVSAKRSGLGMHGGAAPDWLADAQEAERQRRERSRALARWRADQAEPLVVPTLAGHLYLARTGGQR